LLWGGGAIIEEEGGEGKKKAALCPSGREEEGGVSELVEKREAPSACVEEKVTERPFLRRGGGNMANQQGREGRRRSWQFRGGENRVTYPH